VRAARDTERWWGWLIYMEVEAGTGSGFTAGAELVVGPRRPDERWLRPAAGARNKGNMRARDELSDKTREEASRGPQGRTG
jgi:hypothetical protein